MRCLRRNKQQMYYATLQSAENETKDGLLTSTRKLTYSSPVKILANFAQSKKRTELEAFGIREDYDGTIVTADMNCPIKEDSIMWIGISPYSGNDTVPHNYAVVGRFPSLNYIVYAVKKVLT